MKSDARLRISVLINTYNKSAFLVECVESLLTQTRVPDEIVVVDDGSTDESVPLLMENYGDNPRLKIITQENQGQVTAIATGIEVATGDILCLLDGDDTYKAHYLERLEEFYLANPKADITFCRFESFGAPPFSLNMIPDWLDHHYDFGYSALLTYFDEKHPVIGTIPSCTSLRKVLAKRLWLKRAGELMFPGFAENAILIGAALRGGRKFYFHDIGVNYRHHPGNHWGAKTGAQLGDIPYQASIQTLAVRNFYRKHSFYSESAFQFLENELATVPKPHPKHEALYQDLLKTRNPGLLSKIGKAFQAFS